MKNLKLGLDLGVGSVGFTLIRQGEKSNEIEIVHSGVRVIPEDPNFHGKFYTGNSASKNADRRSKRLIRRGYKRYQTRKEALLDALDANGMRPDEDLMYRITALELYELRARGVEGVLSLQELGRVFFHLNQKRGFLSNRKSQSAEETQGDYLAKIQQLHEALGLQTIGQYFYDKLQLNPAEKLKENIFPRADYIREFDLIWQQQKKNYPDLLSGGPGEINHQSLYELIRNRIIYYQRPLKSQKNLVGNCRFEKSRKVSPKSAPMYQLFRMLQQINTLEAATSKGEKIKPDEAQRKKILEVLHSGKLNKQDKLTKTEILKLMGLPKSGYQLNYEEIEGNKTYRKLLRCLEEANVKKPEAYLFYNHDVFQETGGLEQLWHITYSLNSEQEVADTLMKYFPFSEEQANLIARKAGYTSEYGAVSTKAMRRIIPGLIEGHVYSAACELAGYKHSENEDEGRSLLDKLPAVKPNELRNPVVEQVLNQMVNVVNEVIAVYGKPDEVRIELARELKNSAKKRQAMTKANRELESKNKKIQTKLMEEHGFKRVNARDLLRYRLWEETNRMCLYSGKTIPFSDVYNGKTEIEHIIPKSRSFNDGMSNLILAYVEENKLKDQATAMDFMIQKGEHMAEIYRKRVMELAEEKRISFSKKENLLIEGTQIPKDFVNRQIKDTQYISREAVERLRLAISKVTTTTGSVTDFLREQWGLNDLMREVNLPRYREIGQTEYKQVKDEAGLDKNIEVIKDWSKRNDHRHHAIDATIVALTSQGIIKRLNDLNQDYETYKQLKESARKIPCPIANLRAQMFQQLDQMLISFKKPGTKVMSKKVNKIKTKTGNHIQIRWEPRGSLHEDTVLGRMKWYSKIPLDKKFNHLDQVVNPELQTVLAERLKNHNNDPAKAFAQLSKNPVLFKGIPIEQVVVWDQKFTKRVKLGENMTDAQIKKIADSRSRELIEARVKEAGGIKNAFKEYESNPIWLNEEKRIMIKSVSVLDSGNLTRVREGQVYTKGNHHAIIYTDGQGNYEEKVVSFWEAVEQAQRNLEQNGTIYPIINPQPREGWKVLTTLQINDLFVFDLDPAEIDFLDPKNRNTIAKSLFRVQKLSASYYVFRHQYETKIDSETLVTTRNIRSSKNFNKITKVRVNKLGQIIWFQKLED